MAESEHSSSENASMDSIEEHSKQDSELEFSDDEETLIIRMFNLVGERWSLIAGRIPGRTAEEIEKMRRRPAAGGASTASASAAEVHMILVKAEEAAQESRQTKQDRCAEMRRKKDEEREAEEQSQMYSFGRSCCRIQVENLGRLSGVMDDRGKYIYISMDETNAVADYIKREGRVSISNLASRGDPRG
ncbi:hypothetical protein V6N13_129296 [Hibiscus sabdariffa]